MKKRVVVLLLAGAGSLALAQEPSFAGKTLRMIVPFGPGSGADAQGRLYAELLGKQLGIPAYVENRPGANGAIGLQQLKSAPADGLTIAVISNSLVVTPLLMKNVGYRVADFRPIVGLSKGPIGFFVRSDAKQTSLSEMLAAARKDKRAINIGTYSGSLQIGVAWLSILSAAPLTHVPYKGASNATADLIGGSLDLMSADLTAMLPLVRAGKLRPVAVASEQRMAELPDVPALRESYKEYVNHVWSGLAVRADTPPAIVERLSQAMQVVMAGPESRDYLARLGLETLGLDAAGMARFIEAEERRSRQVAASVNLQPE